jgi:hypothetical protein
MGSRFIHLKLRLGFYASPVAQTALGDPNMHLSKHLFIGFTATSLALPSLSAQDRKLNRSQLPLAVVATIDRETQGATIVGYGSEKENGRLSYEVETKVAGHTRDLAIAPDGSLMEVEEEVAMGSLDGSVQSALQARAEGARIFKVESLTKSGKLVAYEASTLKGKHKGEVQVGPNGEALKHPE